MNYKIVAVPHIELTFTGLEIAAVVECCRRHYDATCRAAGTYGGVFYGMLVRATLSEGDAVTQLLSVREADLMAKCVAGFMPDVEMTLGRAFREVSQLTTLRRG